MFSQRFSQLTAIYIIFVTKFSNQLECVDENGDPVDWYIVYKVPKLEKSKLDTLRSGHGYTYITAKSIKTKNDWILSAKHIDSDDSIFGRTVSPVIKRLKARSKSDMSFVVYNDHTPDSKLSPTSAHAKGLFAIDSSGGFWFIHSVPKFPNLKGKYDYPDSGVNNGQIALCVSLGWNDEQSLTNIATQLLIMRPLIYDSDIQNNLGDISSEWFDVEDKKWIKGDTDSQLEIRSKKGVVFTSFSKSNKYSKDLFSGLIAPYFKEDLLVQTWRNGPGERLASDCIDTYKVQNVDRIELQEANSVDWEATEDHSKWGITSDRQSQTCIADNNRMRSQFKRGGGSLCMNSSKVWKIFKNSIETIEGCGLKKKKKKESKKKKDSKKKKKKNYGSDYDFDNSTIINDNSTNSVEIDSE